MLYLTSSIIFGPFGALSLSAITPLGQRTHILILAKSIAKSIVFLHAWVFAAESTVKFVVRTNLAPAAKCRSKSGVENELDRTGAG